MASTYTPIYTTTLASAQSSITLNSFSGYTDLKIVFNGKVTTAAGTKLQFNGDTATNYSLTYLMGNGTTVSSGRSSNINWIGTALASGDSIVANVYTPHQINIFNYANTTTYKTALWRFDIVAQGYLGAGETDTIVGLWRSTAAITSISLFPDNSTTYAIGTSVSLYGILAA